MTDKKCEILAPVGGHEQLLAAVRCGADAVYLGTKGFNARRNAENVEADSLREAVSYCHARGVKLYVTVNTLITDAEKELLEDEARMIAASGADAVIIQDMAVFRLFRDRCPTIKRHASTQTAVHNCDGAKLLRDIGYDRIVLARELSMAEMEKIINESGIEAEAFVHGAHCMSLSGACYLSAMLGGRSGNRGLCAQPCRLDFRIGDADHALSLKDMSYIDHIRELADIGVASFKIEGRMKRPEYVAAAVTACGNALAGKEYDKETLQAVFSRSGFTDGYLTGSRGREMFGFRTKEDVTAAGDVLSELSGLYRAESGRIETTMALTLREGIPSELTVSDGENSVTVTGAVPEKAINRPTDEETAYRSLSKTGGTPFRAGSFSFTSDGGLMMPVSGLNALRRDALDRLTDMRGMTRPHPFAEAEQKETAAYKAPAEPELWIRCASADRIPEETAGRVILPLREIAARPGLIEELGERLTGELPAVSFPEYEEEIRLLAGELTDAGLRSLYTDNIYGIYLGNSLGVRVIGGAGLNIANTDAALFYAALGVSDITVSFEISMNAIRRMGGGFRKGYVAYGYLPLMRLRACPGKLAGGCAKCGGETFLTDRKGVTFRLECFGKRYSTLLNSVPLHIADRDLAPADYMILWFTSESGKDCARILREYRDRAPGTGERTGGLYYRKLL